MYLRRVDDRGSSARVWPIVLAAGVVLIALVAGIAYGITRQLDRSHDREIRQVAVQRAQLANELGSALPILTEQQMRRGFSSFELLSTSVAVERLRESQPLLGLTIFDRQRRLIYPPAGQLRLRVPAGIGRALGGSPAVERLGESDPPIIEASVPIRDVERNVIGALVVSLDEDRLREEVGKDETRVFVTLVAAAALLWLLLLPVSVRLARLAAPYVSVARWRTARGVRRALTSGGLEVHYQPKITLANGAPCGAEGLVRWRRDGRVVSPGAFLPHVERSALVHDLTAFVVDRAVADAAAWRRAGHDLGVSVNLSPQSFADETLPELVGATLAKHGLEAAALTLEVTETAVFNDAARVESILNALAQLGVPISIDDFGTGHSSLARLQRFPISEVKIDRLFVGRMTADERPFVDSIARLADTLGLEVVAEGVEDIATLELLAKSACRTAQGFFFCRPLPLDEFTEWLVDPHATDMAALEKAGIDHETATIEQLVESARRLSGGDVAWLAHFNDDEYVFVTIGGDQDFFSTKGDSIPLNESYCARMVAGEIPNAIADARAHRATRGLGITADAGIGSYVGVPVRLPAGDLYGSLCAASHASRSASPETVRLLSVLAGLIGQRLA